MTRAIYGELRRVATEFRRYCSVTNTKPTPESLLYWMADPRYSDKRLGWTLTQAGEQTTTGRPE